MGDGVRRLTCATDDSAPTAGCLLPRASRVTTETMRFRVIVFDFDGTLVDSNSLKRDAFDRVFADRPACLLALPDTLARLKNESRYEIIRSLVDGLSGLNPDERRAEADRRTEAYSTWVEERILERARQSPADVLLPRWRSQAALYVCSLTPAEPLRRILQKAGWLSHFDAVEGHPVNKADMLRRTVSQHGMRGDQALMVGDGDGDALAAAEAGTAFFRIETIADLGRLDQYLLE
jgi:phosphoglycolate phosphatase